MTFSTIIIVAMEIVKMYYLLLKLRENFLIYIQMHHLLSIVKLQVKMIQEKPYLKGISLNSGRDLQADKKSLTKLNI